MDIRCSGSGHCTIGKRWGDILFVKHGNLSCDATEFEEIASIVERWGSGGRAGSASNRPQCLQFIVRKLVCCRQDKNLRVRIPSWSHLPTITTAKVRRLPVPSLYEFVSIPNRIRRRTGRQIRVRECKRRHSFKRLVLPWPAWTGLDLVAVKCFHGSLDRCGPGTSSGRGRTRRTLDEVCCTEDLESHSAAFVSRSPGSV